MASIDRITVTLPDDLIREMDRLERNRSRFVAEAVRHELEHRRRQELRRSLVAPHPESKELAEAGFDEWARALPDEDAAGLVDPSSGTAVRWVEGEGWVEENA